MYRTKNFLIIIIAAIIFTSCQKKPSADFSALKTTFYIYEDVTFTNNSIDANSYQWEFGDGQTSTEESPAHTYSSGGTYTVKLTVYSKNGNKEDSKTLTIIAEENEKGAFTDVRDGQTYNTVKICDTWWMAENLNYYTASGSWIYSDYAPNGAIYGRLYNWQTACAVCPDGWQLPSNSEWQNLIDCLGGENVAGQKMSEIGTTHWDSPNSGTNSSGFTALPGGIYMGSYFQLLGSIGFFWNFTIYNSWQIEGGDYLYHNDNGGHTYGLNVRCIKNSSSSGQTPVSAFSSGTTTITVGETVSFTDQSTNVPTSWSWDFGDGGTSALQNPSHTYNTAGTYSVSLTSINSHGSDIETKTNYISVNPISVAPISDFSANQTTIIAGESVAFTDQSTNTPTSWSWDFGDGGTSPTQNPTHIYNSAGIFTVSLDATNSIGSDNETKTDYIVVNALPSNYKTIQEIQGTGASSPYDSQIVSTSGIVTAYKAGLGYFIQDGISIRSGLYIYDGTNIVSLGDEVMIEGTIQEYFDLTELYNITSINIISSGNTLPVAISLSTSNVNNEDYESMLVKVTNALCVSTLDSFNQWQVDDGSGTCYVDDLLFYSNPTLTSIYTITGVLYYGNFIYRIEPRTVNDIILN